MTSATVFLDRDGVINVPTGVPHTYITRWEDFHFVEGAAWAIRKLCEAGFRVVVATNQRGVARGCMSQEVLDGIHEKMVRGLASQGALIDAVYCCPHEGGSCDCRKPGIGLFAQADAERAVDKKRSFMVGDSESDIKAGRAFGLSTVYIGSAADSAADLADATFSSLREAYSYLIERLDK